MDDATRRIRRRIKLRDLETLAAVASAGGISKAAVRLNLSQPAVSKAVSALESAVGYALVTRHQSGVDLTPFGLALLKRANAVFDGLDEAVRELTHLGDPEAGDIKFACSEPLMAGLISVAMERMTRRYPRVRFHTDSFGTDVTQIRALEERAVDFVISRPYATTLDPLIQAEPLYFEKLLVVVGRHSPWAKRRKISLTELADASWILARGEVLNNDAPIARSFQALGLPVPIAKVVTGSVHLRIALIESGPFVTALPRAFLRYHNASQSVKVLPITLARWQTPNMLLTLRNRPLSPATHSFLSIVRELAIPLNEP